MWKNNVEPDRPQMTIQTHTFGIIILFALLL